MTQNTDIPSPTLKDGSYREETGLAPHEPTRLDAEVQVRDMIAPDLIMRVYVSSPHLAAKGQLLMDALNEADGGDRVCSPHGQASSAPAPAVTG